MDILILRNKSASNRLSINDLGIDLGPGESTSLISNFENEQIVESLDLQAAMTGDAEVLLNAVVISYTDVVDYFTGLSKYDKIDYAYISGKDSDTDITGAELERLSNGSDVSSGTELHNHDTRYYTKTNLQTSGQSQVHWNNITNAPAFGSLNWKDPVQRTDSSYGSGLTLPIADNALNDARMVSDDGDGKPAQYVCVAITGTWDQQWKKIADIDWGNASGIGITANGNLTSTNVQNALVELQTDIDNIVSGTLDINHSLDDAYQNGSIVTINNTDVRWLLSDTKFFAIQSDGGSTNVLKISANGGGDVIDIAANLNVVGNVSVTGSLTVNATTTSLINVTGAALNLQTTTSGNISISSADSLLLKDKFLGAAIPLSQSGTTALSGFTATSIVGALNELKNTDAATTLDQAYEGAAGNGSGRVITAENGSVKIDASGATNAPFELVPQTVVPSTGLASGQMTVIGDELYIYDGGRSKWLSADSTTYIVSMASASGQIMSIGGTVGNDVGFKMPMKATLVKVSVSSSGGNATKGFEIRKVGSATPLKSFSLTAGSYMSSNDNISLNLGDIVQVYVVGQGTPVKNPIVTLFIKWQA